MTITPSPEVTRRRIILTAGALAFTVSALPGELTAEAPVSVQNRLADLAGVDALPRDLLRNLTAALDDTDRRLLERDEKLPADLEERVLKGLYSGVLPGKTDQDADTRIAFSSALKWAAVDRTNNVISYCGGVPHFWATPPGAT
ncbi:hypothetical protein [Roseovarius aquimarinus]|uniref:Membrane bound FAD containing D-sorbitol dehydrogenase n=1 Tax=Roseovarius aquimarinus TaxID=1229156 RepID=A0ABW7I497_9RHOB